MTKSLIDCNQPRNVKAHPSKIMKTRLPKRRRGERRQDGRAEASVAARSRGRACDRSSLILWGALTPTAQGVPRGQRLARSVFVGAPV